MPSSEFVVQYLKGAEGRAKHRESNEIILARCTPNIYPRQIKIPHFPAFKISQMMGIHTQKVHETCNGIKEW